MSLLGLWSDSDSDDEYTHYHGSEPGPPSRYERNPPLPVLHCYQEEINKAKRYIMDLASYSPEHPRLGGVNPKALTDRELLHRVSARDDVDWPTDWRYHRVVRFFYEIRGYHGGDLDLTGRTVTRYEKLMARWHAFLDAFRQLAPHVDEVEATRLEPDEVTHRLVEKPYRVPFITSMEIWKQFRTEWKISPSLDYEWFARVIGGMQKFLVSYPTPIFQALFLAYLPPEILHLIYQHAPFKECCRLAMTSRYLRQAGLPFIFERRALRVGKDFAYHGLGRPVANPPPAEIFFDRERFLDEMRFLNTHTDICGRLQSLTLANNWRDPFDHNVNMDSDDHPLNFELFDPMLEAFATFVRRSSLTTMCLSGFLIDRRMLDALMCQHRMVEVGFNSCQLSHCAEQYVIDTFELRIPLESRIKYVDICMTRAQEQQTLWLMLCLLPQLTHLSVHATSPDRGFLLATDEDMPLLADTLRRLERLDLGCIAALEFARLVECIPDNLMDVLLQAVHAGSPPLAVLALDGAQLGEPLHLFDLVATLFPDLDGLAIMRRARPQRRSDTSHWPLPVYEYAARLAAFRRLRYFGANFRYEIFDDPPDLRVLFDGPLSEKQRAAERVAWEREYGADPLPLAHQALARPFAAHCPSLQYMAVPLSAYYCQIERTRAGTVNCTSALFTGARGQAAYRVMEGYNPMGPGQSWGKRPRERV